MTQFDLLRWVGEGAPDGVYEGHAHRVSARALHNRGLIRVSGSGRTWHAELTTDGVQRLAIEAKRIEAERERARAEALAAEQRQRDAQLLRERSLGFLARVVDAGGRLDLGVDVDPRDVDKMCRDLAQSGSFPTGERLAQEPTRMDPTLGLTVYLEPDFDATISARAFRVLGQLRDAHPAVETFLSKRSWVSKSQIPRAARFLQAIVSAVEELGWRADKKSPRGHGEKNPDLLIKLPSRQVIVTMHELDGRGRRAQAYITERDYFSRTESVVRNPRFDGSGKLEVVVAGEWDNTEVLALRDTDGATLEDQLPVLVRLIEVAEAEREWARQEEIRRSELRKERWAEARTQAFVSLTYQRNAEQLQHELERRALAAAMRAYSSEIDQRSEQLDAAEADEARRWAAWVREHAERTDPLNGRLQQIDIASAPPDELEPHMGGWSPYGPYRGTSGPPWRTT